MIVDGRAVYSCSTLAIECQGKTIRNIDGLAQVNRYLFSSSAERKEMLERAGV